jgi:adenosylcobinamide-phosphate synthase
MDTIANYIPARLTAVLMILAAWLLGENWRKSWTVLQRDKKNTASPNAGWTISAMAGALNIQLEKLGFYVIGDNNDLSPIYIFKALRIMRVTAILFGFLVVFPFLVFVTFLCF